MSPALNALILRLLAVAPVERFEGRAREVTEALEQAAEGEGPEADVPLFTWAHEHRPRLRSPEGARLAAEQDAVAREEQALREVEERTRARAGREQAPPRAFTRVWRVGAVAFSGLLLAGLTVGVLHRGQEVAPSASDNEAQDGDTVAVGDSANTTPAETLAPPLTDDKRQGVRLPLPEKPFPGQSTPPCKRTGEVEIHGGCWYRLADARPPCKEEGKEEAYAWKGACYGPSYPVGRKPTSNTP